MLYGLLLEDFTANAQSKEVVPNLHTGLDEEELRCLGMEAWVPSEMVLLRSTAN